MTVEDWFRGHVKDQEKNKKPQPQFLQGSAMYNTFGGEKTEKDLETTLNELVSLNPPADDDPVSKKVAKFSWIYRSPKVSFATGSTGVAKKG